MAWNKQAAAETRHSEDTRFTSIFIAGNSPFSYSLICNSVFSPRVARGETLKETLNEMKGNLESLALEVKRAQESIQKLIEAENEAK